MGARGLFSKSVKNGEISFTDYVKIRVYLHVFAVNAAGESLLSEHFHGALSESTPDPGTIVQNKTTALKRLHEGKDDLCIDICSG